MLSTWLLSMAEWVCLCADTARFMDPLAHSVESALTGQPANPHLPEIIGIARGWELTGNSTLSDITHFFCAETLTAYRFPARFCSLAETDGNGPQTAS